MTAYCWHTLPLHDLGVFDSDAHVPWIDCKNKSDEVLAYLFEARYKWFAYGPADAIATLFTLAPVKSRMVYLSGAGLPRLSWKKGC